MTTPSAIERLSNVLREAGAVPSVRPELIAPSSIYDPVYRVGIIGCAFSLCAEWDGQRRRRMNRYHLKLLQFVAIHPALLPQLMRWVADSKSPAQVPVERWLGFPAGYVADSLHDQVIEYLTATGELSLVGRNLTVSWPFPAQSYLHRVVQLIVETSAFRREKDVLRELAAIRFSRRMLDP